MDVFIWDHNFETGLCVIDAQHRRLVYIINDFGALLAKNQLKPADIEILFNELFTYTRQHFLEEEGLMTLLALDQRHQERHIKEHKDFLQEITFMHRDLSFNEGGSGHALLQFLNNWLAYHLLGCDKSLSRQIAAIEAGMSAAAAYENEVHEETQSTQTLLAALNNLFQQVSERNRQLVEMNWTLEEKVAKRTLALSEANRNLEVLALTDVLTKLPNRRHAMRRLAKLWQESIDNKVSLSCMMIDADGFKNVNDQFGHTAGDAVLYALARRMREAVRNDDIVCRLGGDEFLVICPLTPLDGAMHLAEILRSAVADLRVPIVQGEWLGSVSIGVAARSAKMMGLDDLIKAADEGVYAAKRAGRNCVRAIGV